MKDDDKYIGDGLYANNDGFAVTLYTERGNGRHYVVLEPEVIESFLQYLREQGIIREADRRTGGGK